MTRPPFPTVFDSTIVAAVRSCHRKAELEFFHHYRSKEPSVHLVAGAAFAAGLEATRKAFWLDGQSEEDAIALGLQALLTHYGDFQCPPDSAKSKERTAGAFEFAMAVFPLAKDGTEPIILPGGARGIEFSFVHPLPVLHPETGDPILYAGRADQIVRYAGGVYVEDDKTTSQLGASWPRQWDLRSQFTGYSWGCREAGIKVNGVLVRGLSILKTKYDKAEALTIRPDWQIERWFVQVCRDLERLKRAWEEGYYDYNLDHACSEYGGCPYRQVCLLPEPQQWLDQFFQRRSWNPVTRKETVL